MEPEPLAGPSDQLLMSAVRDGDVGKLSLLFERHHGVLFNFLLRLTGDWHLSEDLVQEVFMRVLKYRHTYRGESHFTTWMFQIARNVRADHFRSNKREDLPLKEGPEEYVSALPTPAERVEENEEMTILLRALSRLPEEKREVLLLHRFQGMKYDQIAEVLNCPVNTVRGRAFRAIRDLQATVMNLKGERAS